MTLHLCVPRCAHVALVRPLRAQLCHVLDSADEDDPPDVPGEPPDPPIEEDDWDEPDPAPFDDDAFLDFCEIDDAPDPDSRDYWDDSLDREWDCAPAGR